MISETYPEFIIILGHAVFHPAYLVEQLGTTKQALWKLIKTNRLKMVWLEGKPYVTKLSFDRYMADMFGEELIGDHEVPGTTFRNRSFQVRKRKVKKKPRQRDKLKSTTVSRRKSNMKRDIKSATKKESQ